jgi:hypothetical protein
VNISTSAAFTVHQNGVKLREPVTESGFCRISTALSRIRAHQEIEWVNLEKIFAHYAGRRCRQATIKDIAQGLSLDWDTVKTLEKQYMQAQLARAGN